MGTIISCSIDKDDLEFCHTHQIKISHLLRWAVSQKREDIEGGTTLTKLKENIERLQGRLSKLHQFIEKKGLFEEYIKDVV